jgi:hypothetical protein
MIQLTYAMCGRFITPDECVYCRESTRHYVVGCGVIHDREWRGEGVHAGLVVDRMYCTARVTDKNWLVHKCVVLYRVRQGSE